MINEKTFSDLLADIDLDEPNSNAYAATECFELSMQMSIDFGVWLSKYHVARRGGIWVSDDGVISTTEQLFELYLTENK